MSPYHRLWTWILHGAPESPRLHLARKVLGRVPRAPFDGFLQGRPSPALTLAGAVATRPSSRKFHPLLRSKRLLVKSVHAPLSIEWIASEFDVDVLVVLRHPGSILASWIALNYVDQYVPFVSRPSIQQRAEMLGVPLAENDHLERTIWQIGVLLTALEKAASHQPTWVVRTHEQLGIDPVEASRQLYGELGLRWNEKAEAFLTENDRPGQGFRTRRVAAEMPDKWKKWLTPHQVAEMQRALA
ncbi:MAG: hypothetical protein ACLQPH_14620 [Acidimicrobiales bacterium]